MVEPLAIYRQYPQLYNMLYGLDDTKVQVFLDEYLTREPRSGTFLDLGCGIGTHSIHLAKQGHHVVGMDPYEGMLKIARERTTEMKLDVSYETGSFEDLAAVDQYGMILALNGSFSYVLERQQQRQGFINVARALTTGGVLIIDVLNFISFIKTYSYPNVERFKAQDAEFVITVSHEIDSLKAIWNQQADIFIKIDGNWQYFYDLHPLAMLSIRDFQWLADAAGLAIEEIHRGYMKEKEEYRLIVVFRKPTI